MGRLYNLTDAGRKAWDTQSDRVPIDYRRVLGFIGRDTELRELCAKLGWSEAAMEEILKELEERGLVKSVGAGSSADELDFSGNFLIADIQAAQQRMREELDFTASLSLDDLRAAGKKR